MKHIFIFFFSLISIYVSAANCDQIIYVKEGGAGMEDGTSWSNAYRTVQEALDAASTCTGLQEIWVAEGTYPPTVDVAGSTTNSFTPNRTYVIDRNIRLYGGFRGDETSIEERIQYLYPSVLTGDQLGDDVYDLDPGELTNATDNSFNIMRMKNLNDATVIDGFTFRGGNAVSSSSTLSKKIGGAIFNDGRGANNQSTPKINNCIFRDNYALLGGGAIYNFGDGGDANPIITNCDFRYNAAPFAGGAVFNLSVGSGFTARHIYENCVFFENLSALSGGAVVTAIDEGAILEQTFAGCTWVDNDGAQGNAIFTDAPANSGTISIVNSIAWDNSNDNFASSGTSYDISYTNYDEAVAGNSSQNTSLEPDFIFQNSGILRLKSSSPLIGMGDAAVVDISHVDRDGIARTLGDERDMGAYEFLTCPPSLEIYVNDTQTTFTPRGTSVNQALKTLDAGLAMACNCPGRPTIYLSKGTYFPANNYGFLSPEFIDRRQIPFEPNCPMDIIGGQPEGSFDPSGPSPSILQGDYNLDDGTQGAHTSENSEEIMRVQTVASTSTLKNLSFQGGYTSLFIGTNFANVQQDLEVEVTDCDFRNVEGQSFGRSVDLRPNLGTGFSNNYVFTDCEFRGNTGSALRYINSSPSGSLLLDNCIFQGNIAPDAIDIVSIGTAILGSVQSKIVIRNCLFEENYNQGIRGSTLNISCSSSSGCDLDVSIVDTDFNFNYSISRAGALVFSNSVGASDVVGSFEVTNCDFSFNRGGIYGACLFDKGRDLDIGFSNCRFQSNSKNTSSSAGGGALSFIEDTDYEIRNCTFVNNRAEDKGGAVYTGFDCVGQISNSVFWGNRADGEVNSIEDELVNAQTSLRNCLIEEPSCEEDHMTNFTCPNTIFGQDPMFTPSVGFETYTPAFGSPLIDAGDNNFAPSSSRDFGGDRPKFGVVNQQYRIINNKIDIGAREFLKNCSSVENLNPSNNPFNTSSGEILGGWTTFQRITLNPGLHTDNRNPLIFDTPDFNIDGDYTFYNNGTLEVYTDGCSQN